MTLVATANVRGVAERAELEREVRGRLEAREMRFTQARRAIVRALRAAHGPVTLPELLELVPDLAQSSAYRNLALLEEAGVVHRVTPGGDHARYELAEALTEHHHHLVCAVCGLVRDVAFSDEMEAMLDQEIAEVAAREHFRVDRHVLDLHGLCATCASAASD